MDHRTLAGRASRRGLSILASLGLLAGMLAASTGSAAASGAPDLTCSGGDFGTFTPAMITSGTYHSITVTGFCEVASGASIVVTSGLTVAPGGFLVAAGALDNGMQFPDCNRRITVGSGVSVQGGGSLILGDGPGSGCRTNTMTTVNGGLRAMGAIFLIVHGVTVHGSIMSAGGGDHQPCNFAGLPTYATVEDSHVSGGVSVSGYEACWLGFARNHIDGGVSLRDNHLDDPDAMEILDNTINGGLACSGNSPVPTNVADGVQFEPNTVHGAETGQCAGL